MMSKVKDACNELTISRYINSEVFELGTSVKPVWFILMVFWNEMFSRDNHGLLRIVAFYRWT